MSVSSDSTITDRSSGNHKAVPVGEGLGLAPGPAGVSAPRITPTDGELLTLFTRHDDRGALDRLVDRHAAMVWRVCRATLRRSQDAEDAFQATFLLLVRSARSIKSSDSAAGWLYRVAYRTSLRARKKLAARREESLAVDPDAPGEAAFPDLLQRQTTGVLVEELMRLPAKYQTPLVMRYLEGQSRRAIADQTDTTIAAVQGQLARGKQMLRHRLLRRGVSLAATMAALGLGARGAKAAETAPAHLVASTTSHSVALASGGSLAASAAIVSLYQEGARAMLIAWLGKPVISIAAAAVVALMLLPNAPAGEGMAQAAGLQLALAVDEFEEQATPAPLLLAQAETKASPPAPPVALEPSAPTEPSALAAGERPETLPITKVAGSPPIGKSPTIELEVKAYIEQTTREALLKQLSFIPGVRIEVNALIDSVSRKVKHAEASIVLPLAYAEEVFRRQESDLEVDLESTIVEIKQVVEKIAKPLLPQLPLGEDEYKQVSVVFVRDLLPNPGDGVNLQAAGGSAPLRPRPPVATEPPVPPVPPAPTEPSALAAGEPPVNPPTTGVVGSRQLQPATVRPSQVEITSSIATSASVDNKFKYRASVSNISGEPIANLRVELRNSDSLKVHTATAGKLRLVNGFSWSISSLLPGASFQIEATLSRVKEDSNARITAYALFGDEELQKETLAAPAIDSSENQPASSSTTATAKAPPTEPEPAPLVEIEQLIEAAEAESAKLVSLARETLKMLEFEKPGKTSLADDMFSNESWLTSAPLTSAVIETGRKQRALAEQASEAAQQAIKEYGKERLKSAVSGAEVAPVVVSLQADLAELNQRLNALQQNQESVALILTGREAKKPTGSRGQSRQASPPANPEVGINLQTAGGSAPVPPQPPAVPKVGRERKAPKVTPAGHLVEALVNDAGGPKLEREVAEQLVRDAKTDQLDLSLGQAQRAARVFASTRTNTALWPTSDTAGRDRKLLRSAAASVWGSGVVEPSPAPSKPVDPSLIADALQRSASRMRERAEEAKKRGDKKVYQDAMEIAERTEGEAKRLKKRWGSPGDTFPEALNERFDSRVELIRILEESVAKYRTKADKAKVEGSERDLDVATRTIESLSKRINSLRAEMEAEDGIDLPAADAPATASRRRQSSEQPADKASDKTPTTGVGGSPSSVEVAPDKPRPNPLDKIEEHLEKAEQETAKLVALARQAIKMRQVEQPDVDPFATDGAFGNGSGGFGNQANSGPLTKAVIELGMEQSNHAQVMLMGVEGSVEGYIKQQLEAADPQADAAELAAKLQADLVRITPRLVALKKRHAGATLSLTQPGFAKEHYGFDAREAEPKPAADAPATESRRRHSLESALSGTTPPTGVGGSRLNGEYQEAPHVFTEPTVIETVPARDATDVDPGLKEIRITFDRDMGQGMSWTGTMESGMPPLSAGRPARWIDKRTCVLRLGKLEPGRAYRVGINAPSFKNFKSADGKPAAIDELKFTTAAEIYQYGPEAKMKQGQWNCIHRVTELNPVSWATVADLQIGEHAPIKLLGDARPRPHVMFKSIDGKGARFVIVDPGHADEGRVWDSTSPTTIREVPVEAHLLGEGERAGSQLFVIRHLVADQIQEPPTREAALRLLHEKRSTPRRPIPRGSSSDATKTSGITSGHGVK